MTTDQLKAIRTPWGEIGYIVFKRTYSRTEDGVSEELHDVIMRELKSSDEQLHVGFTDEEKERYYVTRKKLKWSVAGRFMWQLGTKVVDKLGLPSLQNCAFTVIDHPIRPFTWAFDMLMLGSGVGYSIQKKYVSQLPRLKGPITISRVDENDADFIVPDSREGWIKLLSKVLKAHFYGEEGFTYALHLIRSKGAPIKSFGGVAAGPEEFHEGIQEIHKILNSRAEDFLRPIDCLDIMNLIGYIVVSGNVRRSAEIAVGDPDDKEFLMAKRWDLGPVPNWRSFSNNSVGFDDEHGDDYVSQLPREFWETYEQGEPYGIINLKLFREVGRTGETQYPDPGVKGVNPCAEQGLDDKETCCLAETFLPNIESYEELLEVLGYAYRMNKHSLFLGCHLKETEDIVHKNYRMGIGLTGVLQATEEQRSWLSPAYEWLREYDRIYSEAHGFPVSVKLTTMKPSGTMSQLGGMTPGGNVNPAGPYFIRRVIIASNSPLIEVCRKYGYNMEYRKTFDGQNDTTAFCVEFPCAIPEHTPTAANTSWRDQMDMIRWLQANWSDNAVSCTVQYKKKDLPEIKQYLRDHLRHEIKSVSFLLYSGHGFAQAPYETISVEKYQKMVSKVTMINEDTFQKAIGETDFDVAECSNGACPVK